MLLKGRCWCPLLNEATSLSLDMSKSSGKMICGVLEEMAMEPLVAASPNTQQCMHQGKGGEAGRRGGCVA